MAGNEITTEKTEAKKPADSNWFVDNIAHPFANAAALEPYNAVASVVNAIHHDSLPELTLLSTPEASGVGWLTQNLSSGIGGLLPFVVAGKLTGSSMRGTGRFLESANLIEGGGLVAKGLASERLAMITGAGLYGAAQKPQDGQTRFGNAAASAVGMGAFELGGKLTEGTTIISLAGFRNRAVVGFAGGSVASMTGNYIGSWMNTGHGDVGSLDSIAKAGVSGAAFNMFLPAAQRGVDTLKLNLGMSIPVTNYAAREGWGRNQELAKIVDQSPLTNVTRTDGAPSINQDTNVVALPKDAKAPELGHEVAHRIRLKLDEVQFQDAAAHLDPAKPELFNVDVAKQKYVDIRVGQEQAARDAQNRVAGNNEAATDKQAILDSNAQDGLTYGQKFEQEADQFAKDGKFRPAEDNAGKNPDTGLFEQDLNPPIEKPYGLTSKYEYNSDFERYTIVDTSGQIIKNVEVHKNAVETDYGTVKVSENLPNNGVKLHIIKGTTDNSVGLTIPDNSTVEYYSNKDKEGNVIGVDTRFGKAKMMVDDPATGQTSYRMADGTKAFAYNPPQSFWDDYEIDGEHTQIGRTVYDLTNGGKVETYEGGLKVGLVTAGKSEPLDVLTVVREDGQTTYMLRDTSLITVANDGNKLTATRYNKNLQPTENFSLTQVSEGYPIAITVNLGDTAVSNVNTSEHRVDSSVYRASDSTTQVYDQNHSLPTPFGDVRRVEFRPNDFKNYVKDDGTEILTRAGGINSPYGPVVSIESLTDHTKNYTRRSGDAVREFPPETPINVLVGRVASELFGSERINANSVETTANGLILRSDNPTWKRAVIDFGGRSINTFDADDNMLGSRDLPADFKLIRQFPPSFYPDGVISPYGPVRTIETDANGANTWKMVDGKVHK